MVQDSNRNSAAVAALIALYMWAESALLAGVARILRHRAPGVDGTVTSSAQVRRLGTQVAAELETRTPALLNDIADEAAGAAPPPPRVPPPPGGPSEPPFDFRKPHGQRAADAIVRDLASELQDVRARLTRLDDDVYKAIAPHGAIEQALAKGLTPQQAQAAAYREFTMNGVTGFTDKSGRRWSLSAYVEMAVRTAYTRAVNAASVEVIQATGINLVTVPDDGHPCPLCFPWQNRVLCIIPDGVHPSMDDARAAGLWHPNCRHTVIAVTSHTKLPEPREWTPAMQDAYDASQRQRALERGIRHAKQELEYATTPEGRQKARQDVRTAQAALRRFMGENPNLLRKSRREQPQLSMMTTR